MFRRFAQRRFFCFMSVTYGLYKNSRARGSGVWGSRKQGKDGPLQGNEHR